MRGKKTGGRTKGTPNKRTIARQQLTVKAMELAAKSLSSKGKGKRKALPKDATPLQVMMMAMREAYVENGSRAAAEYAKDAAPYVHPRLAALVAKINPVGNPWDDLLKLADGKSRGLPGARRQAG